MLRERDYPYRRALVATFEVSLVGALRGRARSVPHTRQTAHGPLLLAMMVVIEPHSHRGPLSPSGSAGLVSLDLCLTWGRLIFIGCPWGLYFATWTHYAFIKAGIS